MTPERWQEVDKLLEAALEQEAGQRATFLDQVCAGDEELRQELESLLASHERAGSFLKSPAAQVSPQGPANQPESLLGQDLGHCQLLSVLGEGGMGIVYKAHDRRLDRDVAIKVLPPALLADQERKKRFAQEAKAASALNHPNIVTVHEIASDHGMDFIVMEYVAGKTLDRLIPRKGVPLNDALKIAIAMSDALTAAHAAGIVHRDLKPGNVMVGDNGQVKVVDFGLAKLVHAEKSDRAEEHATRQSTAGPKTEEGMILGTASYMSPEQIEGKKIDARSDIFSFGAVLYEMITGRRAFGSDSQMSTLSAVLREDPKPASQITPGVPGELEKIVNRCLRKNPERRLQYMVDVKVALEELKEESDSGSLLAADGPGSAIVPSRTRLWRVGVLLVIGGLVGAAIIGFVTWNLKTTRLAASRPVTRFVLSLPPDQQLAAWANPALALAPDGTRLVYAAAKQGGQPELYLRPTDRLEAAPIQGTEGGFQPFFSPDGQWLGFFAAGKLKKVSLQGGPPVTLCDAPDPYGATWAPNDTIIFAPRNGESGLERVPAAGGLPRTLTTPDRRKGEAAHTLPEVLPDGKAMILTVRLATASLGFENEHHQIAVRSLETGQQTVLVKGGTHARYAASNTGPGSTGHLIYARALGNWASEGPGTLLAIPFDPHSLELASSSPVPVVEEVVITWRGTAWASFSRLGGLVYAKADKQAEQRRLVWVDRRGATEPLPLPGKRYHHPALSPDGGRIAVGIEPDIWVHDLTRGTLNRLTLEHKNYWPIWTHDGKRVAYSSSRDRPMNLFWINADGSGGEERLTKGEQNYSAASFSPDGKWLAYYEYPFDPRGRYDIWLLPLDGEGEPRRFFEAPFNEVAPMFSPDGGWLAYVSNESGRQEVYVQSFPGPGRKWPISNEGGREPLWARNGTELFYRVGDKMLAVDVTTSPSFSAGKPKVLFEGRYRRGGRAAYDIAPDGQRFLMVTEPQPPPMQLHVVLEWFEDLKSRTRSAKQ
jgi:Tol biopolymer transport system component/predicted Ser/Thr protein kinase